MIQKKRVLLCIPSKTYGGDDVRKLRNSLCMTQQEFSNAFNIPLTTIVSWENSRRNPSMAASGILREIAKEESVSLEMEDA
jgi:DNA-binding transcriptional regulator YiaG